MRTRIRWLCSAAAALAGACSINPVTRRPEFVVMSRDSEARLGEQEARSVAQELGILQQGELARYVSALGGRLAQHSPRQDVTYRFLVVDSDIANAFALPGGYVYVTRGLLPLLNSEDELANVLGHEIGHVAARHAVQRVTAAAPLAIATGIPAAAVGLVLPRLGRSIGTLGQFAGSLALAPYSRAQEEESDRLGQEMAAAAGWNPAGLPEFMTTLQRHEALGGGEEPSFFFRTHPLTEQRVAKGAAHAEQLARAPAAPIAATRDEFLARLDGLLVGENPAEGIFRDGAFLHADLDLWLRFPEGWSTRNGREFVTAEAPSGEARIVLQIAAEGSDALGVAREFARAEGAAFGLLPKPVKLARHDGARAYGRSGDATLDVSWIGYAGRVFQVTGVCRSRSYDVYQTPFIDVALSLRPLTQDERDSIGEERLRIVPARDGESLARLVARSESRWSAEQAAVANALAPDARLRTGQPVKLPIASRYSGAADEAGSTPSAAPAATPGPGAS